MQVRRDNIRGSIMESQHGSNLKNIRKKRATAQQSIVSLSCLVCIAFAAIWGFHAGSGNSRAVEAKKMSASSSMQTALLRQKA